MISVVIPALNESCSIQSLLISLKPLRDQGHEIIVVDGGSNDATAELARKDADLVITASPGRARQMNAGASHAHGGWFWFVHADSDIEPLIIEQLVAAVDRGCSWGWFEVTLRPSSPLLVVVAGLMNMRARITRISTGDMGLFVERALFERAGGFENIPLMEDIRLTRTLKSLDRNSCVCAGRMVTSSRRWTRNGTARTILLMWYLRFLHWIGVAPERLVKKYYR